MSVKENVEDGDVAMKKRCPSSDQRVDQPFLISTKHCVYFVFTNKNRVKTKICGEYTWSNLQQEKQFEAGVSSVRELEQ